MIDIAGLIVVKFPMKKFKQIEIINEKNITTELISNLIFLMLSI